MNRLIRVILYITAGCVGIGCAALILSFALGGGRLAWEEAGIVREAAQQAREIASRAQEQVQSHYDYVYQESDALGEAAYVDEGYGNIGMLTVDASSIHDLSIDLQHGSLSVQESEDNLIRVSVSGSADGLTAECESGGVVIKDHRTGSQSREDAFVLLEIPYGMRFQNVSIQINAGVMEEVCGFQAENLTVNADAGEIVLSDITADVLSASVGAGATVIADSVFERASLDCGVGTINIEADIRGNAEVKCGMGTVNLELAEGAGSKNYTLHCGAGSIQIGENTYSGLAKESKLNNGASATFTLDCGMGVIYID